MPDPWSDDWSSTKKTASEKTLSGAILGSVQPQGGGLGSPQGFRQPFTLKTRDKSAKLPAREPPKPAVVLDQTRETYEEKQRRYQEVREKLLGKE